VNPIRVAAALVRERYSRKWEIVCPFCGEHHRFHAGAHGTRKPPAEFLGVKVAPCKQGLIEVLDGRRDIV
jgi:hypothetical protein